MRELKLPVFTFEGDTLELQVDAQIDGRNERLPIRLHKRSEQGWMVEGDRFPALPSVAAKQPAQQIEATAVEERLSRPVDRRQRFSLAHLQRNPEQYRDLVVRIGGYTDYFVRLSPGMRQEVMRRTEYEAV